MSEVTGVGAVRGQAPLPETVGAAPTPGVGREQGFSTKMMKERLVRASVNFVRLGKNMMDKRVTDKHVK